MSHEIPAIFDAGVFRPLRPVYLTEGTPVVVRVQAAESTEGDQLDEPTRQAWLDFVARMESLPDEGSDDGFSGRDHDRIIYGI
jgi:predicted DNA-binding antitoxin AbrB/MazE fold protein